MDQAISNLKLESVPTLIIQTDYYQNIIGSNFVLENQKCAINRMRLLFGCCVSSQTMRKILCLDISMNNERLNNLGGCDVLRLILETNPNATSIKELLHPAPKPEQDLL